MGEPLQDLKQSLDNWAAINKENAEIGFVDSLYTGALKSSPIVDKYSSWLLAGTGATAALMITSMDKLLPFIGIQNFKASIYLLIVSALFGFLAKYKAIFCLIMSALSEEIKKLVIPVLDKHSEDEDEINKLASEHNLTIDTEIDISKILTEYSKAFPPLIRPLLAKQFNTGLSDRLSGTRKAANSLFWQSMYTLAQTLMFLVFLYVAVSNIKSI